MKPLFFVFAIFAFACVNAQSPVTVSSTSYLAQYEGLKINTLGNPLWDANAIVLEDAPGQRMIRVGKTLTIAGSILLVGGIAMMATADDIFYTYSTDSQGSYKEGDPQGAIGLAMTTGGLGMIIPGAIVWSKGKKKYEAYQSTGASLSLGINRHGAGLRLSF